jgi:hypothetical protein
MFICLWGSFIAALSNDQGKLVSTLEFDHLLVGKQISHISDGGQGDSDSTNTQNSGYGLKMSVLYEKNNLSVGPYLHYWNIQKSDVALSFQNNVLVGIGWEPKNNTVEFGLKLSRHF